MAHAGWVFAGDALNVTDEEARPPSQATVEVEVALEGLDPAAGGVELNLSTWSESGGLRTVRVPAGRTRGEYTGPAVAEGRVRVVQQRSQMSANATITWSAQVAVVHAAFLDGTGPPQRLVGRFEDLPVEEVVVPLERWETPEGFGLAWSSVATLPAGLEPHCGRIEMPWAASWWSSRAPREHATVRFARFPWVSSKMAFVRSDEFRSMDSVWSAMTQCWPEGTSPRPLPVPTQVEVDGAPINPAPKFGGRRSHLSWLVADRSGRRRTEVVIQGPPDFGEFLTWRFETPDDALDLPAGLLPEGAYAVRLIIHDTDRNDPIHGPLGFDRALLRSACRGGAAVSVFEDPTSDDLGKGRMNDGPPLSLLPLCGAAATATVSAAPGPRRWARRRARPAPDLRRRRHHGPQSRRARRGEGIPGPSATVLRFVQARLNICIDSHNYLRYYLAHELRTNSG